MKKYVTLLLIGILQLILSSGVSLGVNFTKVTGQLSPGVIIDDESFQCWFSPTQRAVPSGSAVTTYGITYNGFDQITGITRDVNYEGVSNVHSVISSGLYNGLGQVTGFSETRVFIQTSKTYSISVSGAVYDGSGRVTSFSASVTVASPEMDVQGNSVSIADGDSTPVLTDHTDFGSALVASGTVVRTFTIRNTGNAVLNLTGNPKVAVSGTHASEFTVTAQPSTPVAASGTTTFQVTFDPAGTDTRSAVLSIANDDSNENPYNFSIQGIGTAPPEMQSLKIGSGGSVVVLHWTSITNHLYTIHCSTNLMKGFFVVQSNIPAMYPMNAYTDTISGVRMKAWKVSTEE